MQINCALLSTEIAFFLVKFYGGPKLFAHGHVRFSKVVVISIVIIVTRSGDFVALKSKHVGKDRLLQSVDREGRYEHPTDVKQGVEQATKVAQPVQKTVSLPIPLLDVQAKVYLNAGEFVPCAWVFVCREVNPCTG